MDLTAFGHTHKPWHRVVDGVHSRNTGSVGKPKDGDWRAGYALVEVELPDEFADQLRDGGTPTPVEVT